MTETTAPSAVIESASAVTEFASAADSESAAAPLRVAVVIGSNREGRFGPVVAEWLLARVRERTDLVVDVVDLADADLPTSLSFNPSDAVSAELAKVTPKLAAADAFIVLTPEYNHSYPASLKSLIDWHGAEWQAKPVALVSYGGLSGGLRAVEHLRPVLAELHAVTIRDTVSFHNAGALFDAEGNHQDPAGADAAAKTMLDQLAWWAWALRSAKEVRPYGS
ncbi:NADPH-dependent FMN reductase [Streptomyces kanamyceticus]|uniref:NADPH-dependent oxidoreductase n=1 Tax=Streptomyces kanamyceticus TaxID=1967 RepID=A0A5J6GJD4_STRKN|nr:NAD(P)H-dependent oxidoreductase [Streptomyces kanamyceticus]QEU94534.1 NADPH-dependent oxidoreductase [Streptomyces kanamyceticus]